jgi:hypothetical protein
MADDAIASTPVSQPLGMEVLDVAAEGDVVFNLKLTRLRVSSAILASASPVFKVMLGPVFLEGQDFRSAQYPKQIPLEHDSAAIMRLCFLLHHKCDPKILHLRTYLWPMAQRDCSLWLWLRTSTGALMLSARRAVAWSRTSCTTRSLPACLSKR